MKEWLENKALQDNWQTASFSLQTALWLIVKNRENMT